MQANRTVATGPCITILPRIAGSRFQNELETLLIDRPPPQKGRDREAPVDPGQWIVEEFTGETGVDSPAESAIELKRALQALVGAHPVVLSIQDRGSDQ